MEILRTIQAYAESRGLTFLVIGGHAINCYGLSRQTGDIDLLIDRARKIEWYELLNKLDYQVGQSDDRFARFRSIHLAAWPIDFMLVDSNTFSGMYSEALDFEIGICRVKVASIRHLIALKIHALKVYQEYRYLKDYSDLLGLLRHSSCNLSADELKQLCLKYADENLWSKLHSDLNPKRS
jgi:hypothetical protein